MAQPQNVKVTINLSDVRNVLKLLDDLDAKTKRKVRGIIFFELKNGKRQLEKLTNYIQTSGEGGKTPPGVFKRTGALRETADAQLFKNEIGFTAYLGFDPIHSTTKEQGRLAQQAYTQTQGKVVTAKKTSSYWVSSYKGKDGKRHAVKRAAKLLTFPIHGKTPTDILPYTGSDNDLKTLIARASKAYYLIWLRNVVLGRPKSKAFDLHSKAEFIFARAPSVYVPKHIDLSSELDKVTKNIEDKLDQLSWSWQEVED